MKATWSLVAYVLAALLALVMAVGQFIGIRAEGPTILAWCLFFFILGHFVG